MFFQSLLSFIFTWLQIHHWGKGIERSGKSFVMVGIPQKFHSQKWWWWLHTGLTKFKHFICVTIIITWIQNVSTKTSLPTQSYQACLHFHLKRYLCEGLRQMGLFVPVFVILWQTYVNWRSTQWSNASLHSWGMSFYHVNMLLACTNLLLSGIINKLWSHSSCSLCLSMFDPLKKTNRIRVPFTHNRIRSSLRFCRWLTNPLFGLSWFTALIQL